jgi:hypothetical protein
LPPTELHVCFARADNVLRHYNDWRDHCIACRGSHHTGKVNLNLLPLTQDFFVFVLLSPHQQTSNMGGLLTLSTEILIQVFAASDSISDALRLSATNHRLRNVWQQHSTQIIEAILRTSIPAYDKALDLAITEIQLQSSSNEKPLLREYLPTLLRNTDLCASACLAYSDLVENAPSPATSYYFLRRVGLGYEHKQIRDILLTELRATSREMLVTYGNMSRFLLLEANITERIRQGVLPGDFDEMGDLYREIESHWDYSDYCIHFGAICDIDHGTNYLPTIVQRYDI